MKRPLCVLASAAFSSLVGGSHAIVAAAPLKLPETAYNYTVIDQDLKATLLEFGSNLGIKVNVSDEVRGRVQGLPPELSSRAFLDQVSALYNLQWYFDGLVLYVTSAREGQSRLLVLGPVPLDRLTATLDKFGISDERFVVRPAPDANLVLTSGPPRFVTLVEQTLAGLVAEEQARVKPLGQKPPERDTVLMVFRGAHTAILRNGVPEFSAGWSEPSRPGGDRAPKAPD